MMMQYADPYDQTVPEVKTSGLAIGALVCSLIFFCPVTTLLGPILGIIALPSIAGNPARKGAGLAIAAILIGLVLTVGWGYGGYRGYQFFYGLYKVVETGPRDAMHMGFAGDIAGFKNSFYGPGASVPDSEAQAFVDELRSRYGEFLESRMDEQGMQGRTMQPSPGQANLPFPYVLEFENETAKAEVEIWFADPKAQQPGFINKLGYIEVRDSERGDLTYPSSEGAAVDEPPAGESAEDPAG